MECVRNNTRRLPPVVFGLLLSALWPLAAPARAERLSFEISFTAAVRSTPFTGRLLVFSGPVDGRDPRFGPDWFRPRPFYAIDVQGLRPGEKVRLDSRALGFPSPPGEFPARPTRFQAVLDQSLDDGRIGTVAGNGVSEAVTVRSAADPIPLTMDQVFPWG